MNDLNKSFEETEIWKPVVGYEGFYEVSSFGRVRSLPRKFTSGGILRQTTRYGYKGVSLSKNNIHKTQAVHRLIGFAFIPNPDNLPQINHKDGVRDNNQLNNLEWVSRSDNQKHAFRVLGKINPFAKLTPDDIDKIRERLANGEMGQDIAKDYDVHPTIVSNVKLNKFWQNTEVQKERQVLRSISSKGVRK